MKIPKINLEDYKRKPKTKAKTKKVGRFKVDSALEEEFSKEYAKYEKEKKNS